MINLQVIKVSCYFCALSSVLEKHQWVILLANLANLLCRVSTIYRWNADTFGTTLELTYLTAIVLQCYGTHG